MSETDFTDTILETFEKLYKLSDGCIKDKLMLFSYMVYSGLGNFNNLDLDLVRKHEFYDADVEANLKMMTRLKEIFLAEQTDAVSIPIEEDGKKLCRNCKGDYSDYYGEGYPCDQCNLGYNEIEEE